MKTEEYEVAVWGVVVEGGSVVVCAGSSYTAVNTMDVFCAPCYTLVAEILNFLEKKNIKGTVRQ